MKWLSMPNAQPDNLLVKGIKCNVAAKVEGLNTSDQSISNEFKTEPSKSKTQKHIKSHCGKEESQKKTPNKTFASSQKQPTFILLKVSISAVRGRQKARLSATLEHRLSENGWSISSVCTFVWISVPVEWGVLVLTGCSHTSQTNVNVCEGVQDST